MRAIIYFKGTPLSKQHGHRVSFKHIAEHMRLKDLGIKSKPKFFYSTSDYADFKETLGWEAAAQLRRQGWTLVEDEPVWISVMFRSNRNLADMSNLLGGIEDALNGLAWRDDTQALIRSCYGMMSTERKETEFTVILESFDGDDERSNEIRDWVRDGLKRRRKRYDKQDKVRGIPGRASRLAPA